MPELIANAETVETTPAGEVAPADTVTTEDSKEKPLDEMTPEELKAYAEKLAADRDDWRGKSRKNEDAKKAATAQFAKLQEQLNASKPNEEVLADRLAALEAKLAESAKETAILKLSKDKNLPDEALTILQNTSLENLESVADTILAVIAATQAKAGKSNAPALPVNSAQGTESKVTGLTGADAELYNLLNKK